jgi:hypothetical protein
MNKLLNRSGEAVLISDNVEIEMVSFFGFNSKIVNASNKIVIKIAKEKAINVK